MNLINKIIIVLFILLCTSLTVSAQDDVIIRQGDTVISLNDVDGFAFRMPNDIRRAYFSDVEKVDKLLGSLLNYKHVYNYNRKNMLLNSKKLTKRLDTRVSKLFAYDESTDDLLEKQSMFMKIKKFLEIEETYKMMQEYIINSINEEALVELAKEKYTFNKNNYQIPETRTIKYISIEKNIDNSKDQKDDINRIIEKLKKSEIDFDQIVSLLSSTKEKIIVSDTLENITYNNKNAKFSKFLYSVNEKGLMRDILETKSAYIIINIIDIKPARAATFSEVQSLLISKIKKEKSNREFNKLLLQLTKDPVNINKENLTLLSSRYN